MSSPGAGSQDPKTCGKFCARIALDHQPAPRYIPSPLSCSLSICSSSRPALRGARIVEAVCGDPPRDWGRGNSWALGPEFYGPVSSSPVSRWSAARPTVMESAVACSDAIASPIRRRPRPRPSANLSRPRPLSMAPGQRWPRRPILLVMGIPYRRWAPRIRSRPRRPRRRHR